MPTPAATEQVPIRRDSSDLPDASLARFDDLVVFDHVESRVVLIANAMEALIGAVYLDQGYDSAERFIAANVFTKIDEIVKNRLWQDSKSAFQERAQELEGATPNYSVLREIGPDHGKVFVVGAYIRGMLVAQGEGRSKQDAEQAAARAGLDLKGW